MTCATAYRHRPEIDGEGHLLRRRSDHRPLLPGRPTVLRTRQNFRA